MNYVIFDLEWNRYARHVKAKCPDEIIQFGAVKVDEKLNKIGEFRKLVKPVLYKKIEPTIADMTGLEYDQLTRDGENFNKAMKEFRAFMGKEPFTLISWGIHDTIILRNNCRYYNPNMHFEWMKRFVDLQYYASRVHLKEGDFNQLGLAASASELGIPYVADDLHDALVDASLTYEVFRRIYDKEQFEACLLDVSQITLANHPYRATSIVDINSPLLDKSEFCVQCPQCGQYAKKRTGWSLKGKKFIAFYHCNTCDIDLFSSIAATVRMGTDVKHKKRIRVIEDAQQKSEKRKEQERAGADIDSSRRNGE